LFSQVVCEIAQAHFDPEIDLQKFKLPRLSADDSAAPISEYARVRLNCHSVEAIAKVCGKLNDWVAQNRIVLGLAVIGQDEHKKFTIDAYSSDELTSLMKEKGGLLGRIVALEGIAHSVFNHFIRCTLSGDSADTDLNRRYALAMDELIGAGGYGSPSGHLGSGNSTGMSILFGIGYAALNALEGIATNQQHEDCEAAKNLLDNKSGLMKFLSRSLSSALALSKIQVNSLVDLESGYFSNKCTLARLFTVKFRRGEPELHMLEDAKKKFIDSAVGALHMSNVRGATWTECPATRANLAGDIVATEFLRDWVRDILGTYALVDTRASSSQIRPPDDLVVAQPGSS